MEIGFEWSTAGISIGTYFVLKLDINDLDDDITSKVLKFANDTKVFRKLIVMQIDSIYKMILIS